MSSMCVGNVPIGMYSDKTMTTTTNYDFNCDEIVPGAAARLMTRISASSYRVEGTATMRAMKSLS